MSLYDGYESVSALLNSDWELLVYYMPLSGAWKVNSTKFGWETESTSQGKPVAVATLREIERTPLEVRRNFWGLAAPWEGIFVASQGGSLEKLLRKSLAPNDLSTLDGPEQGMLFETMKAVSKPCLICAHTEVSNGDLLNARWYFPTIVRGSDRTGKSD